MIDKRKVTEFFNSLAPSWDEGMADRSAIITQLLDKAGICRGLDVLDVACGTGVLFPYYLERGVRSVTGIDISPEMVRIAADKFAECGQVSVVCGDVEEHAFGREFDVVMVYNAFPHFPDAKRLIETLSSLTRDGGRLSVAHSMSRAQVNDHHKGSASPVSNGLMSAEELGALFEPYFAVDVVISNDAMYQVSGVRKRR